MASASMDNQVEGDKETALVWVGKFAGSRILDLLSLEPREVHKLLVALSSLASEQNLKPRV